MYPGADDKPDPQLKRTCLMRTKFSDLIPFLTGKKSFESGKPQILLEDKDLALAKKKFLLLVGEDYNPYTDELILQSDRFPEYGENKKWIVDTLTRLITEARVSVFLIHLLFAYNVLHNTEYLKRHV